jgi:hypothetical protein
MILVMHVASDFGMGYQPGMRFSGGARLTRPFRASTDRCAPRSILCFDVTVLLFMFLNNLHRSRYVR